LLLAISAAAGWVIAEFARLAGAYQPGANCTRFPCGDNVTGTVARLRPWPRASMRPSPRLWPSRRSAITFAKQGVKIAHMSPNRLGAFLQAEAARFGSLLKNSHVSRATP
jgi:hypothetical protein